MPLWSLSVSPQICGRRPDLALTLCSHLQSSHSRENLDDNSSTFFTTIHGEQQYWQFATHTSPPFHVQSYVLALPCLQHTRSHSQRRLHYQSNAHLRASARQRRPHYHRWPNLHPLTLRYPWHGRDCRPHAPGCPHACDAHPARALPLKRSPRYNR